MPGTADPRPLLAGDDLVRVLLLDAALHLLVEPVAAVILADPGPVRSVGLAFPANVVGRRADMLAADDDVGLLRANIAPVTVTSLE